MAQSTFVKAILKFIANKLWPWFKEHLWPILREHILELVVLVMSRLKEKFKSWAETRSNERQEHATQKAQEAEKSACDSATDSEKQKYEAIARVWREVVEQIRVENEALKSKIEELTSTAEAEITTRIRDSNPTIDFSLDTPALIIGEKRTNLPALPDNSN